MTTIARRWKLSATLATLLITTTSIASAEETIGTDRPSFGSAAATVPDGMVQLEGGVDVAVDDTTSVILPVFLVRAGITDVLEARIGLPSVSINEGDDGLTSLQLGLKYADSVNDSLSLGVLPYLDLPDDEEGLFGQATFGAVGLADLALTDWLGLSVNFGLAMTERDEPGEAARQIQQSFALAFGASIGGGLGAYVEAYEIWQPSFESAAFGVDGGLTYGITNWLQVDAYANAGLTDELTDLTFGVGIGILGP